MGEGKWSPSDWAAVLTAISIAFWWLVHKTQRVVIESRDEGTEALATAIESRQLEIWYRYLVDGFLNTITYLAGDKDIDHDWSVKLFDRVIFLAFLYPVGAALISWAVVGDAGPAGVVLGLKSGVPLWSRSLVLFTCFLVPVVSRQVFTFIDQKSIFITVVITIAFVVPAPVSVSLVFALIFALVIAVDLPFSFALTFTIPLTFVLAVPFAFAFTLAFASIVSVVLIFAIRANNRILYSISYGLLVVSCGIAMYILYPENPEPGDLRLIENSKAILIYLFSIPIVNSLFNFVSIGTTRKLLRCRLEAGNAFRRIGWSCLDCIMAILITALLMLAMSCYIEILNRLASQPLLPIEPIHEAIKLNPWDPKNYWIYITLLSTLIPTFIHLSLALIAGFFALPYRFIDADKDPDYLRGEKKLSKFGTSWLATRLVLTPLVGLVLAVLSIGIVGYGLSYIPGLTYGLIEISEFGRRAGESIAVNIFGR